MNVSEIMFEELCGSVGIGCRRIAEAYSRTPDFEVELTGHRIVVEIKQFDPKEEEAESTPRTESRVCEGIARRPAPLL